MVRFVGLRVRITAIIASIIVIHVLAGALIEPVYIMVDLIDPVVIIVLIGVQIEDITLQLISQNKESNNTFDANSFQRFEQGEVNDSYLLSEKGKHYLLGYKLFLELDSKNILKPLEKLILIVLFHGRFGHQDVPNFLNLFFLELRL